MHRKCSEIPLLTSIISSPRWLQIYLASLFLIRIVLEVYHFHYVPKKRVQWGKRLSIASELQCTIYIYVNEYQSRTIRVIADENNEWARKEKFTTQS